MSANEARRPDSTARGAEELDDVPGSRVPLESLTGIPTESLADSPQGRLVTRRKLRLVMAWNLFCSMHSGHVSACQGDSDKARSWCWRQADKFLADHDKPTTPTPTPTSVAVNGGPHAAECVKITDLSDGTSLDRNCLSYLLWMSNFEAVPPSAVCPGLGPDMTAKCRRKLLNTGHVKAAVWEDSHGYAITQSGRLVAESRSTFDAVSTAEAVETERAA